MRLIEAKLNGEVIEAAPVEEAKPTEDVLAGLMASIEAVKAARKVSSQAVTTRIRRAEGPKGEP